MIKKVGPPAMFTLGALVAGVALYKLYDSVGHRWMYWLSLKADEMALRKAYQTWSD